MTSRTLHEPAPTLTAHIPSTEVNGFEAFHDARKAIYAADGDHGDELAHLLERTTDPDGMPLIDTVIDQITAENAAVTAAERLKRAKELSQTVLSITMSENGEVIGVTERTEIPVDEEIVSKQRAMADKIGYGPKQNRSSFKVSRQRAR